MSLIGDKLKTLRKSNGYSIKKVVEKLNEINIFVKEKSIYRWESNKVIPDIKVINALSNIYNTNITCIYEDSKYFKSLNENVSKFINYLREDPHFKKIIMLLARVSKRSCDGN